jgi:phage shock protein PspC (stress-responsive transcriptional regulator)
MSLSDELEKLQALRDRGTLSEEEFARAKAQLLGQPLPGVAGSAPHVTADSTLPSTAGTFLHRLARSRSDRLLGGVCGGLGAHTGLPSWAWRVIFCLTALYFGIGLLLYVLLWLFLPLAPP